MSNSPPDVRRRDLHLRLHHSSFSLLLSADHAALLRGRLALHLFGHLDVDFEELTHAAVEADRLALVEVGFAVLGRDALLGAGVDEPGGNGCLISYSPFSQ